MLSISLFIHHLFQYAQGAVGDNIHSIPITFLSDNQGLVTRVTDRLQYDESYPNATLQTDWDLVEQIVHNLKKLPFKNIQIEWVKGHQDDTEGELSVEAQYNIDADALAGQHRPRRVAIETTPAMLPAAKCMFLINNHLITGHYTKEIRDAYTLPQFFAYLEQRQGWTRAQRKAVNWQLFHRAATHSLIPQVQMLKLIHGKSPTNEIAKSNPLQSPQCHYCDARETFHHLCTCHNAMSSEFRSDLIEEIDEYMHNHNVPATFHQSFLHCIQVALEDNDPIGPNGNEYLDCISKQNALGTTSILQGFWTAEWHIRHEKATSTNSHGTIPPTIDFLAGLMRLIWRAQLRLWEKHLKGINSPATTTTPAAQKDKLDQYKTKIRLLHAQRHLCLHGHRELYFYPDLDHFLQTATGTQMRQYLHQYEPAIQASILAAKRHPARSILTFPGFTRATPTSIPRLIHRDTQAAAGQQTPISTDTRGTITHHKHTRWKRNVATALTSIRAFFNPKPA